MVTMDNRVFRTRLKAAIYSAGFENIRQFCEQVEIDEATMSKIIRGWMIPSDRHLDKIARGLDTPLELVRLLI